MVRTNSCGLVNTGKNSKKTLVTYLGRYIEDPDFGNVDVSSLTGSYLAPPPEEGCTHLIEMSTPQRKKRPRGCLGVLDSKCPGSHRQICTYWMEPVVL